MTFKVYVVWGDGEHEESASLGSLAKAATAGLGLADEIGRRPMTDGKGPPARVDIYDGGRLELSIAIIPGGLLGRRDAPRLRAI